MPVLDDVSGPVFKVEALAGVGEVHGAVGGDRGVVADPQAVFTLAHQRRQAVGPEQQQTLLRIADEHPVWVLFETQRTALGVGDHFDLPTVKAHLDDAAVLETGVDRVVDEQCVLWPRTWDRQDVQFGQVVRRWLPDGCGRLPLGGGDAGFAHGDIVVRIVAGSAVIALPDVAPAV